MNKFKKLVAVLVSVVMACVFATGVFAADYVDDLSAARAEVNGYLTSAGVYGMDGVVNSLNIDVVVSGSEVAVVPTASANGVSGTAQWKYATDGSVALLPTRSPLLLPQSSRLPATTALWSSLPSFCLLLACWVWLSVRRAHWLCKPMQHPMSFA